MHVYTPVQECEKTFMMLAVRRALISFSGKKQMAIAGTNSASVPSTLISYWVGMFTLYCYCCATLVFEYSFM